VQNLLLVVTACEVLKGTIHGGMRTSLMFHWPREVSMHPGTFTGNDIIRRACSSMSTAALPPPPLATAPPPATPASVPAAADGDGAVEGTGGPPGDAAVIPFVTKAPSTPAADAGAGASGDEGAACTRQSLVLVVCITRDNGNRRER
jgi:hypothetical protein